MLLTKVQDSDNARFFDNYSNLYASWKIMPDDVFFLDFIKNNPCLFSLLDIGGGNGIFAQTVLDLYANAHVAVVDPSQNMISKIKDHRIKTYLGALPDDLPAGKYTHVHVKDVLHHIVGDSTKTSRQLARKSLRAIHDQLDDSGYLFLSDVYHEGWLCETLPRTLIFYALKTQNHFWQISWRLRRR